VKRGQKQAASYFERELEKVRGRQPPFVAAVVADARVVASARGERAKFRGRIDAMVQVARLMCVADAFVGQVFYRAQARLYALGVPVLPHVAHRLAMITAQVCVGKTVVIHPGVGFGHGQVVIDGFAEIHSGVWIYPWVTIGLRGEHYPGPTVGPDVRIGTGAKVLGPVTVHRGARVGANAVVIEDVPAGVTVVGVPAKPVGQASTGG
jgi:serine O-acetyltransferase